MTILKGGNPLSIASLFSNQKEPTNASSSVQQQPYFNTDQLNASVDLDEDAPLIAYEEQSFTNTTAPTDAEHVHTAPHAHSHTHTSIPNDDFLTDGTDSDSLVLKTMALVPGWYTIISLIPVIKKYSALAWAKITSNKYYILPFVILVSLIITYTFVIMFESELVYIHRASFIKFTEMKVTAVNDKGLDLFLSGHIFFDYSNCTWLQKAVFVPLSFILGVVSLNFPQGGPIDVFYNFPDLDSTLINPAKIYLPEYIEVNVTPRSFNTFDMSLTVDLTTELPELYNKWLYAQYSSENNDVNITLLYKTEFHLATSYVKLGRWNIGTRYEFQLSPETFHILPDFSVLNLSINPTSKSIQTQFDVVFSPLPYSMDAHITDIEWDAYIPGCGATLLQIGSVISSEVDIKPLEPSLVSFKAQLPELERKAQKFCPDGLSPLNRFINSMLSDQRDAKMFLKAKSLSELNRKLPKWFELFLGDTFQPVSVNVDEYLDFIHSEPLDYQSDQSAVMILNDNDSPMRFQGDFHIKIPRLPWGLSNDGNSLFVLHKVMGDLAIVDSIDDEILLKLSLISWQDVHTDNDTIMVSISDSLLDISQSTGKVVKFIEEVVINGAPGELTTHYALKSLLDLDMRTPISNSIFQRIEDSNQFIIPSLYGPHGSQANNIPFLSNVHSKLHGFKHVSSSNSTHLRHFIDLEVDNSLNKFGVKFQYLNLLITHTNVIVGTLELSNVDLDQLESHKSQITMIARWSLSNDTQQAMNHLVSNYVSGLQPTLMLQPHIGSSKVQALTKVLNALPAMPFQLPTFFQDIQLDNQPSSSLIKDIKIQKSSNIVKLTILNPFNNANLQLTPLTSFNLIHQNSDMSLTSDLYLTVFPILSTYTLVPGLSELEFAVTESELYRFIIAYQQQTLSESDTADFGSASTKLGIIGKFELSTNEGFKVVVDLESVGGIYVTFD
ncbi:hypothetical protein WICPIJ_008530 [Wickerhamomyces pijperi]|uniref:Uncharacterized protein n=1 Tax=Wickerhamomyces pijperi TaxID=599730 RepID=A0A9P8PWT3_WICPI|nr:hypothetical protein WICPIJ_008530 [Wickerhamomyces pijperi]